MQVANDAGIPIFLIDSSNRATLVPQLTHTASTVSQIESWLDAGFSVEVPRDPVTLMAWTGAGYFPINPSTGFIVGALIGGFLQGGSFAEIEAFVLGLVESGEITEQEAFNFLASLFDRIRLPVDAVPPTKDHKFGVRIDYWTGKPTLQPAVDLPVAENTNVLAVADGIINLQYVSILGTGIVVGINHGTDSFGNTYWTYHGHNNDFVGNLGDFVSQGDHIAESGNTGEFSRGPHVHFEIRIVPPGVAGPLPDIDGAPTNYPGWYDPGLAVDPEDFVWPTDLTLSCNPGCN